MGKLNINTMQTKLDAESQGSWSNADYDKLEQGKNVRRILWPKGNKESFFSEGYLHFSLGADGKKVATCPKTFSSKNKCPICEYVEELQKSKNKDDKKLSDDIKAKRRIYVNVINRDSSDEEETPKVLPIGVTILKGVLETICDPDYGDITDPEDGRDITITRKGQGLKTEYSVLPKPKTSVVSDSLEVEEIEEKMTDLDALFIEKSYDELKAILNDEEEPDSSEDDEEDDADSYDEMDVEELTELCKERGIKIPAKASRLKLITLLNKYDESTEDDSEEDEDSEPEDVDDGEDSDEDDDVKAAIAAALKNRKKK